MAVSESGIWVRFVLEGGVEISGFVVAADSPNDFWVTFKTQLVRVEHVRERLPSGKEVRHDTVYVNRDRILTVETLPARP
ncbi:MAG: hypothetical protein ACREID_00940 [Planctomycetota bacterium]